MKKYYCSVLFFLLALVTLSFCCFLSQAQEDSTPSQLDGTFAERHERFEQMDKDDFMQTPRSRKVRNAATAEEALAILKDDFEKVDEYMWHYPDEYKAEIGGILRFGAAAIPALKEALKCNNSRMRIFAAEAIEEMGEIAKPLEPDLRGMLSDQDYSVRSAVGKAVLALSPEDKEALEVVVECLRDCSAESRQSLAYSLAGLGKSVLPLLIQKLNDPEPSMRAGAAETIGQIAYQCRWDYSQTLEDSQKLMEMESMEGIGAAAKIREENWRKSAIVCSEMFGEATPALVIALKDDVEDVRVASAYSLFLIGSDIERIVPVLIDALSSSEAENRGRAVQCLVWCGKAAKSALPEMLKQLSRKDNEETTIAQMVVGFIGVLGPDGKDALPVLLEIMRGKDDDLRSHAITSIGQLGEAAKEAVPEMIELLKKAKNAVPGSREGYTGFVLIMTLGEMGNVAEEAIPILEELANSDGLLAHYASEALAKMRKQP